MINEIGVALTARKEGEEETEDEGGENSRRKRRG